MFDFLDMPEKHKRVFFGMSVAILILVVACVYFAKREPSYPAKQLSYVSEGEAAQSQQMIPKLTTAEKEVSKKEGLEALKNCHLGKVIENATALSDAVKKCGAEQILPELTLKEVNKYLAQEALAKCEEGDVQRYARILYDCIQKDCVPCDKVRQGLTKKRILAFLAESMDESGAELICKDSEPLRYPVEKFEKLPPLKLDVVEAKAPKQKRSNLPTAKTSSPLPAAAPKPDVEEVIGGQEIAAPNTEPITEPRSDQDATQKEAEQTASTEATTEAPSGQETTTNTLAAEKKVDSSYLRLILFPFEIEEQTQQLPFIIFPHQQPAEMQSSRL